MGKWIALNDRLNGAKLKVAHIEGRGTYLYILGLSNRTPRWRDAVKKLDFMEAGNGRYLIRKAPPGERITPEQFHPVWPQASVAEMAPKDYILELAQPKKRQDEEEQDISDATKNARRLGRNAEGLEVYESDLGRFTWKDGAGATYESAGLRPATVLRAPDDAALDECADGFVVGMALGEVQRSEDMVAFAYAVGARGVADDPALRTKLHAAIDAAMVRRLTREFDTAPDAYGESVRLYEMLPPYSGEPRGAGSMPAPLAVIAQRLLGDTAGRRVAIPNAFDGAAFSFLPKGTRVRAFRGAKDLSRHAAGLTELARNRAGALEVDWLDEFVPAREAGTDAVFFNADPVRDRSGARQDYRDALMAARALADGGRAVFVLAGDDPLHPGSLTEESRRFLQTVAARYEIEEVFETGGELAQRVGTNATLRVLALRNVAPSQDNPFARLSKLEVAHSWDEVKSRVDEAIARAEVREAESASINVEQATAVNQLQSPYIAFSKVGEARTMVPKNLQGPLQAALSEVEELHGPIDDYVARELDWGDNTLEQRLGPEQVDGVGLGLNRMERGRGFINEDETGVGKGRQLATFATWASKKGRNVIFLTDRANLFSDLVRDLRDIGEFGRFRPLITNSDGHVFEMVRAAQPQQEGQEGAGEQQPAVEMNLLVKAMPPQEMREILESNRSLEDLSYNIVFSTYSQIAGEDNPKAQWLKNQLADSLLILDEAHIAAGSDSSIARQVSEMVGMAWNVVYSSSTWAKTVANLHIYSRAFPETVNIASLTDMLKRGGESTSEIFSSMLARDGALVRREHDLSRLEFVFEPDHVNLERNRQVADQMAKVMGLICLLSGDLDKMMVRLSRTSLDSLRAAREVLNQVRGMTREDIVDGAMPTGSIFRSAFGAGNMLYQVQRRMNAALNVDNVERLVHRALAENRKPVVVFDDTGETFVRRAIEAQQEVFDERGNLIRADVIRTPTLRDLMHKVIEDLATVKVSEVTWEEVQEAARRGVDLIEEDDNAERAQQAAVVEAEAQGQAAAAEAAQDEAAGADEAAVEVPAANAGAGRAGRRRGAAVPAEEQGIDVDEALAAAAAEGVGAVAAPRRQRKRPLRRLPLEQIPGLSQQQREVFEAGMREIRQAIDALPEIPLSFADEMHRRLSEAGLRVGEISGRSYRLEPAGPGRSYVRNRPKSKALVNRTVDAFNRFDLDVMLLNRSGATGMSLHASPRFVDHRRRELIEGQPPENPTERVQLYGRVNRYDQVSFPRITISGTGIPGETRHLMMQNKKLATMNANVRSSRESFAIVGSVVDLLNPVGRKVCRQFLLDNPAYATRMAINMKALEEDAIDAASALTRSVSLLEVSVQENLYEQVNQLYEEAILKAEIAGENPLKPREFDWKARTIAQDVVFGIDHGGLGSAFDGPVYARAVEFEQTLRPMNWPTTHLTIAAARQRLIDKGVAEQVGVVEDELRTPMISLKALVERTSLIMESLVLTSLSALPTRSGTPILRAEDALRTSGDNAVKRAAARARWISENLGRMVPGARISLPHPRKELAEYGSTVPHVIVDVQPPREGRESMLGQWKFMLLKPGDERPMPYSLSSLMSDVRYVDDPLVAPGQPHEYGAVSPVRVGANLVDGPRSNNDEFFVRSFDNAISGTRIRHAALLCGNMYLASEFAAQARVGRGMLYTDDRGIRHRAILMDDRFRPHMLRHMPVRVWVRRAVERLVLEVCGLTPERLGRAEDGSEIRGESACPPNSAGGTYLMHTSFAGAWRYAQAQGDMHDAIVIDPSHGLLLSVGRDQVGRVRGALGAAQKRIREEEARQREEAGQPAPGQPAGAGEAGAPAAQQQEGAQEREEAAQWLAQEQAAQPGGRRKKAKTQPKEGTAAADPNHVVISQGSKKAVEGRMTLLLKADTPAKMRRAVQVVAEGIGLQLYVSPHTRLGELARQVVRDDLVRRLRADIGNNPDKLAKLEAQLERMDTEAAAAKQSFRNIVRRAGEDQEVTDLVERDGRMVSAAALQKELEEQQARQEQAEAAPQEAAVPEVAQRERGG